MKEKLTILYNYLKNNDHMQDANRIAKILDEYDKNGDLSELSIKKIKAMCNPRYLGNLYIKEFPDPYKWWNFLAEIRSYFMDFENGIVKIDEEAFSPKYSFEMFRHSSFYKN